jgi:hypothetical protein
MKYKQDSDIAYVARSVSLQVNSGLRGLKGVDIYRYRFSIGSCCLALRCMKLQNCVACFNSVLYNLLLQNTSHAVAATKKGRLTPGAQKIFFANPVHRSIVIAVNKKMTGIYS